MAHIEKYKAHSVGHMLAHYRRDHGALGRENVDPARTALNRTIAVKGSAEPEPHWDTVRERIEAADAAALGAGGRRTRSDAVVMADMVVTLPEDVRPGDEDAFFETCYGWLAERVGAENMLGGFVHRDEVRADGTPARDHMHAAFTPVKDGRFNYKALCPRSFYQAMHKGLADACEARLGYRPGIELGEDERARRLYVDRAKDVEKVREAIVAPAEARAEEARAEEEAARRRLECLQGEAEGIERQVREVERRAGELERARSELAARVERLRRMVGLARDALLEAVRTASGAVSEALGLDVGIDHEWALAAACGPVAAPERGRAGKADGLDVLMEAAREAARRSANVYGDYRVREQNRGYRGRG